MQLMRRQEASDLFREAGELGIRLNRLLGPYRWPGDGAHEEPTSADWAPACDITERENEYRVRAELPDVREEDLSATVESGILTIQGERKHQDDEEAVKLHRSELTYGNFRRRFAMPDDADETKVNATFKHGMLTVVIGKSKGKKAKGLGIAIH